MRERVHRRPGARGSGRPAAPGPRSRGAGTRGPSTGPRVGAGTPAPRRVVPGGRCREAERGRQLASEGARGRAERAGPGAGRGSPASWAHSAALGSGLARLPVALGAGVGRRPAGCGGPVWRVPGNAAPRPPTCGSAPAGARGLRAVSPPRLSRALAWAPAPRSAACQPWASPALAPCPGLGVLCVERGQGRGRRVAGGRERSRRLQGQRACAELRAVGRVDLNAAPSLSWRQLGSSLGAWQGAGGSGGTGERGEPLSSSPRCREVFIRTAPSAFQVHLENW